MSYLISILSLSFLLGMRHAIDADHVVAVSTIVSREKKGILSSALIGILWGIGHSLTVTLLGIPIIFYSFVVPEGLGVFLELMVGLMLVILGILNLTGKNVIMHKHHHLNLLSHGVHQLGLFQTIRPLLVGLVHGLAGGAAATLLILSTIHNPIMAVFYLFIFHIGVVLGMMVITILLGVSLTVAKRKSQVINRYLVMTSGLFSLLFGLYIIYQAFPAAIR